MLRRSLFTFFLGSVRAADTPNPDCLQFRPSAPLDGVLPRGCDPVEIAFRSAARVHPLSELLFEQYEREVRNVFLAQDYVAITKWADIKWTVELERSLSGTISSFLMTNDCIYPDEGEMKELDLDVGLKVDHEKDSEILQCVKELLTKEVRPMVQRDGGDIKLMQWLEAEGILKLKMLGACKSCPSSGNTLKEGIERMLQHFIPEVKEVVEYKTTQDNMLDAMSMQRMAEKKERDGGLQEEDDKNEDNDNDNDGDTNKNSSNKKSPVAAETVRLSLGQKTITATASWNIKDTIKQQLEQVKEQEKEQEKLKQQQQQAGQPNDPLTAGHSKQSQEARFDEERSRGFFTPNQTGHRRQDEELFMMKMNNNTHDKNTSASNIKENFDGTPASDMTIDPQTTFSILGGLSAEDVRASKERELEVEKLLEKEAKEKAERWAKAREQQRRKATQKRKMAGMMDDPEG